MDGKIIQIKLSFLLSILMGLVFLSFPFLSEAKWIVKSNKSIVSSHIEDPFLLKDLSQLADETLEQGHRFFSHLGLEGDQENTLNIKIYKDYQTMVKETPLKSVKEVNAMGYFEHENQEIGVWFSGNEEETKRILRHEIIHQVMHHYMKDLPPWLDEGLAEFLSRDPKALETFSTQEFPMILKTLLQTAHSNGETASLENLFKMDRESFYNHNHDVYYAQSYAILVSLLKTEGTRTFSNFLKAVRDGQDANQWLNQKLSKQSLDQIETGLTQ